MRIELKTEIPGPKSRALMEARRAHVARGPFHSTPVFVARASGAVVEDVDGNRLLDFASGIAVTNLGPTKRTVDLVPLDEQSGEPYEVFADRSYPPVGAGLQQIEVAGHGYRWIRLRRSIGGRAGSARRAG